MRPPATEAHYHNPEAEVLFAETLRRLGSTPKVRAIVLPRNARQGEQVRAEWKELIANGRLQVPTAPVDGLEPDLVFRPGRERRQAP